MLYTILRGTKILFLNPNIFFKKVLGRILLKIIPSPKGVVQVKIGGYTIDTYPSRNDWWKSMYLGCCSVEIAHSIKRYLPPSGVFIDVGAGVGYFSAIASDIIGISGQVHSFEPFPSNAKAIRRMIESNPNANIILNECALGDDDTVHNYYIERFSSSTAASMREGVLKEVDETIEVRTQRLDNYLEQKKINEVSLIKIDVEGYEYNVLKGLAGFFEKTKHKPPIICEIFASAYKGSSYLLAEFCDYMKSHGYKAYNIFNPRMRIDIRLLHETTDVVFIPDS